MLNINQNFDLKAPVFNFDRDYFNSVEELNAYDTSNVPNHFVTNVAGMLYLFTDGAWIPMIGTVNSAEDDRMYFTNIGSDDITISTSSDNIHVYNELMIAHPNSSKSVSLSVNNSGPEVWLQGSSNSNRANIKVSNDNPSLELTKDGTVTLSASPTSIIATSDWTDSTAGSINITTNKVLTEEEQGDGYSPVDISLTDGDSKVTINAHNGLSIKDDLGQTVTINTSDGFRHSDGAGGVSSFYSNGLYIGDGINRLYIHANLMTINNEIGDYVSIGTRDGEHSLISLGNDRKFKISYPMDDTEGATITGVKSIAAFANPSATKVWATDGSTVDLTTKANTSDLNAKANKSDVLLKKNSRGGYYIGDDNDYVASNAFSIGGNTADGSNSFAEGYDTKAYASYSHVEGLYTEAHGESAHAEGDFTYASGNGSHSEGRYTHAVGSSSHAEGNDTYADGFAAHALGTCNVSNKNAIHSVGIGDRTTRKNAEYIYAKSTESSGNLVDDPKNGYKYLIGVGGYDGISTDNTTYKSVQEVIADLTTRIEQLETKVRALEAANTPA